MTSRAQVLVAGVGNGFRGADGSGPAMADRAAAWLGRAPARVVVAPGVDTLDLAVRWEGARLALVDATRSGPPRERYGSWS